MLLPSPEITRDSNVVNRKVKWIINFKINLNSVPADGIIKISFPKTVLIPVKDSPIELKDYTS